MQACTLAAAAARGFRARFFAAVCACGADVLDGLAQDIGQILKASGVGAELW